MAFPVWSEVAPAAADDSFLMEDFQEPVPTYTQDPVVPTVQATQELSTAPDPVKSSAGFSVKKRTYLILSYGGASFPGESWLNNELKDANTTYNSTPYKKGPYTPIVSGTTGGIEVRKGWSDNIMLALAVYQSVGESPEKTLKASGGYELTASARFDVTTTFLNVYLYSPLADRWEYFIGVGPGVASGVIEWKEKENKVFDVDYENTAAVKAFGGQLFAGLDWRMFDNFLLELNVFYRVMEMKEISLTGGGGMIGLVTSF